MLLCYSSGECVGMSHCSVTLKEVVLKQYPTQLLFKVEAKVANLYKLN